MLLLNDFISLNIKRGHFMQGYILSSSKHIAKITAASTNTELRKKEQQIENIEKAMRNDKKIINMINFLEENKYIGTKSEILKKLVD